MMQVLKYLESWVLFKMLRSRISPCLLMHNGGLVKTKSFEYYKYVGDPINAVKIFNEKKVDELVLLDIGATESGSQPNLTQLKNIASQCRMPLCYGGGVNSADMAEKLVQLGIERVAVGDAAASNPKLLSEIAVKIGVQSTSAILNVRRQGILNKPSVCIDRGRKRLSLDVLELAKTYQENGAGEIILSSIDRDGMRCGFDIKLITSLRNAVDIPITVMGGAATLSDIEKVTVAVGVCGISVGSIFTFKGPYDAVLLSYK